jgi:hypothetical protein
MWTEWSGFRMIDAAVDDRGLLVSCASAGCQQ